MANNTGSRLKKQTEKAERENQISELYLSGASLTEIAQVMDISVGQVSLDLAQVRDRWLKQAELNYDEVKSQELARIDRVEREAWKAWHKSCEDAVTRTDKVILERKVIKPEPKTKTAKSSRSKKEEAKVEVVPTGKEKQLVRKGQCGNPAFLDKIQWCITMRLKIWGIIGNEGVNITNLNNNQNANGTVINWDEMYRKQGLPEQLRTSTIEGRIAAVAEMADKDDEDPTINGNGTGTGKTSRRKKK